MHFIVEKSLRRSGACARGGTYKEPLASRRGGESDTEADPRHLAAP